MNRTFPRLGKCEHNKLVKRIAPDFSRQKALTWREKKEDDTKKNTPNQIPCDTMMSFFTASPTKETNLKSSDVKMKEEAKSRVCAACARVCTLLPLCRCFESFVLPCARLLRWGLISIGFDCILRWVNVHLRARVCVCVFTGATQFRLVRNLLLFSLSHLALLLLFLLPLFPPSSFTALPSERGHGEVLSALFWKCDNNNNDDDSFDDNYSTGGN